MLVLREECKQVDILGDVFSLLLGSTAVTVHASTPPLRCSVVLLALNALVMRSCWVSGSRVLGVRLHAVKSAKIMDSSRLQLRLVQQRIQFMHQFSVTSSHTEFSSLLMLNASIARKYYRSPSVYGRTDGNVISVDAKRVHCAELLSGPSAYERHDRNMITVGDKRCCCGEVLFQPKTSIDLSVRCDCESCYHYVLSHVPGV